jgi:hypothetical protein
MKLNSNYCPANTMTTQSPLLTLKHRSDHLPALSRARRGHPADLVLEEASSFERDDCLMLPDLCDVGEGGPQKRLKSSIQKFRPFLPPRTVSFFPEVIVLEIDRVTEREADDIWWTLEEMDGFRSEANTSKCRYRRFGAKRSSRCQNHSRRVIFQQRASEEMDGATDPMYLAMISLESSRQSTQVAIRSAIKMEKEVEEDLCLHSKISHTVCFGQNRWMAEYYLGTVIDTLAETVNCGATIS